MNKKIFKRKKVIVCVACWFVVVTKSCASSSSSRTSEREGRIGTTGAKQLRNAIGTSLVVGGGGAPKAVTEGENQTK